VKRAPRQPTRLGAFELAAEIGHELNVPLDRIGDFFSFDEATKHSLDDMRLLIGRRAEKMFEYVVASLGQAEFIHQKTRLHRFTTALMSKLPTTSFG